MFPHLTRMASLFALVIVGIKIDISNTMIDITTNNSIKVNAPDLFSLCIYNLVSLWNHRLSGIIDI